ncbi:MAG: hypothetical protein JO209_01860 [Acidisphaera sp.]|nr:hypothetical protein [Acidisphaera sp.]
MPPSARSLRPAALALLFAVSGCASSSPQFAPDCPRAAILGEAADLARYRSATPGPHDITDMVLGGRITGISGACSQGDHGTLNTTIKVSMSLTRGPAARGRVADATYFVAVTRGQAILDKQTYPLHVEFPPNTDEVHLTGDPVALAIPTSATLSGAAYTVLAGFQLSPAELATNRQRPAR